MKKILAAGTILVFASLGLWFFRSSRPVVSEFRSIFISDLSSSLFGAPKQEKKIPLEPSLGVGIQEVEQPAEDFSKIKTALPPKKAPLKKTATVPKNISKKDKPDVLTVATSATGSIKESDVSGWCPWKTAGLPQGDVLINEIAWMGSPEDPEAEWIEIKNARGWEVNLKGWQLISQKGRMKVRLSEKILQPGEFYLLAKKVEEPEIKEDMFFKEELRNSGEWLKLFGADCRFIDEVRSDAGWPAGNKNSGLTMERKVAEPGWQNSLEAGGSPRKQNYIEQIIATSTSSSGEIMETVPASPEGEQSVSKVVIASVQIAGEGSDDDRITLYNFGPDSIDVSGWKLRKRTKSGSESSIRSLAGEIATGGYYTWANSKHPVGADATSTQTISADNSVALLDAENKIVDAVAWGSGHVNPFVEGSAFPENPGTGIVLQRKKIAEVLLDSGDNAADFELR